MAPMDMGEFKGVIVVTVGYFLVYYTLMMLQIHGKRSAREASGSDRASWNRSTDMNPMWVMADRSFLNALEQQVPFLLPLWLHAVFVCPKVSAWMGAVAVFARALFPIFWSVKGEWNMLVEVSTQPYYLVVFYFLGALMIRVVTDVNVARDWERWTLPLTAIACWASAFIAIWLLGKVFAAITDRGFASVATARPERQGLVNPPTAQ